MSFRIGLLHELLEARLIRRWRSKRYVCFGGAGAHGSVMLGMLACVAGADGERFRAWRRGLKGIGGCSAGCLGAVCIAAGADIRRILALNEVFPMAEIFPKDIALPSMTAQALVKGEIRGMMLGNSLRCVVLTALRGCGIPDDITIKQFSDRCGLDVRIIATDLENARSMVFASHTTPEVKLADAMVASMSIPIMFEPLRIEPYGAFVDGGIVDSYGISLFPEANATKDVLVFGKSASTERTLRASTITGIVATTITVMTSMVLQVHRSSLLDVFVGLADAESVAQTGVAQTSGGFDLFSKANVKLLFADGIASFRHQTTIALCLLLLFVKESSRERRRPQPDSPRTPPLGASDTPPVAASADRRARTKAPWERD